MENLTSDLSRSQRQSGFTLIELLVTIAVLALLTMVALPSYEAATTSSRLTAVSSTLANHVKLARAEAIKRNATVSLCVSTNGSTCTAGSWHQGWIVVAAGTVAAKQEALSPNLRVLEAAGSTLLSFDSSGSLTTAASFTLCNASAVTQQRQVAASVTGRVRTARTQGNTCG